MSFARSPLEAVLARGDDAALDWLTEQLVARKAIDPAAAPAPTEAPDERDEPTEG